MKLNPAPREYPVTLTRSGKEYTGTYKVTGTQRSGLWVEVSWGCHSKSAHVGGMEAGILARMLLGELVTEHASEQR